jgi:hypothetical protein
MKCYAIGSHFLPYVGPAAVLVVCAKRFYRLGNRRKMAGDFVRTWLGQQKYAYSYFSQALRVRFSRKHALRPPHRQREPAIVN